MEAPLHRSSTSNQERHVSLHIVLAKHSRLRPLASLLPETPRVTFVLLLVNFIIKYPQLVRRPTDRHQLGYYTARPPDDKCHDMVGSQTKTE